MLQRSETCLVLSLAWLVNYSGLFEKYTNKRCYEILIHFLRKWRLECEKYVFMRYELIVFCIFTILRIYVFAHLLYSSLVVMISHSF